MTVDDAWWEMLKRVHDDMAEENKIVIELHFGSKKKAMKMHKEFLEKIHKGMEEDD